MKRIALCFFAVVLLTGIFVHDAAATSVTLLNLTQTWTGRGLSPYVVVSPAGNSYTMKFQLCSSSTCPLTGLGTAFTTPYPTGSNIIGSPPYYYKVTVTTVNASPNVTKTGIFRINPPTTTQGGGVVGGGSTGDIIWIFKGLWSGDELLTPSTAWYAPTSLSAEVIPAWSFYNVTVTTYDIDTEGNMTQHVDTLVPVPPATSPILSSNLGGHVDIWNDSCPNSNCDAMGFDPNGFAWVSIFGSNDFESTFGFTIDNPGIPIYYIPRSDPPQNVIEVRYEFMVDSEIVSIERTWAIDYDHTCIATDCVERKVRFIETTPAPPPPVSTEPEPDDLTVLSASYTKVCETKLLFGWWLYRYKLNVVNNGSTPLANVCGQVRSSSSSVKVIDPEVCFPEIPAGGPSTSKGTFTFMAKNPDTSSFSWIYSSLRIENRPDSLVASSEPQPLSTYVVLSTSSPKSYYVLFHQWLPDGVSVDQAAPLGWTSSDAQVWKVDQNVLAPLTSSSDIRAKAWLLNTLQEAEVTVPIDIVP